MRKIINSNIESFIKKIIMDIAKEKGFVVLNIQITNENTVECILSFPPKLSATVIIKYLKGITGRKILEKNPELRNKLYKNELWNHSYYIGTISSDSEFDVQNFIERQKNSY